ncbi:MAG: substrate-binding domain-containing protein [Pirellulales bacterium]
MKSQFLKLLRAVFRPPIVVSMVFITAIPGFAQQTDFLEGVPPYLPKAPVTGELRLAGSSTMNQLAHLWVDGLKSIHPEAEITVRMIGSEEVLGLLEKGEADAGMMSRALTESESAKYTALPVAKDVVCFVVHPDNPVNQLSLAQLQSVFAPTDEHKAITWGDLGATGDWAKLPIKRYGRSDRSGIRGYLAEQFASGADDLAPAQESSGYTELCEEIAKDRTGIGYVSLALYPPDVAKMIGIADGDRVHEAPRIDAPVDAAYPLVRQLFIVLKGDGKQDTTPLRTELLSYVLSRQGQGDAIRAGLLPLRRDEVLMSRDQLGWTGAR